MAPAIIDTMSTSSTATESKALIDASYGEKPPVATNPMPPYHWVAWRHSRMSRPLPSMGARTVAPVAVKPDTDSNTALPRLSIPDHQKGSAPASEIATHVQPTAANAEAGETRAGVRETRQRTAPPNPTSAAEPARGPTAGSPAPHSTIADTARPTDANRSANPTM